MIRAIRPSAVARDDASLIGGWNIAPNVGYTVSLSATTSAVVVILASADGSTLIGSGVALVGTDQPVTITPVTGQAISMVDADLGWHLLLSADGTEGDRSVVMDPMVDLADEIHPIYTDDNMALARATAAINAGACYVDDVSVACPLGLGAGIGAVTSVPVDGAAVVGQVESVMWAGTPDGTSEAAVIRRHTPIAPEAYEPPLPPPILVDDTAETDAVTAASGNVLANDTGTLTVVAVNGLSANVGQIVAGSNGGDFVINADGSWTFDPSGDFAALEGSETSETSVTYHASNGEAEASATLTVTVSSADAVLWTPAEITTALWLDAADSATITLNGSTVSQWADKSGNGRNATQGTVASQPARIANGVQFDGGDILLSSRVFSDDVHMVFCVAKFVEQNNKAILSQHDGSPSVGRICYLTTPDSSPYDKIRTFFNNGTSYSCVSTTPVSGQNAAMMYSESDGSGRWALRVNAGAEEGVLTGKTLTPLNTQMRIGGAASGEFNGSVYEIICVPIVDASIRQLTDGYLAHKWDALLGVTTLVDALPSDHPYKSAAPTL